MNALSRVVSDLTQKKNSRKLKYETTSSTWDGDDINPMAFCSPFHDPVFQSSLSKDFDESSIKKQPQPQPQPQSQQQTTTTLSKKEIPKLEHGKLDLSDMDYDIQFLKRPNPPLKRMSAAIREKFSTDFLRSKSLQKLNNKDEQDVEVNNNPFEDCKQTSSLSKIKKQARIIDVHVQQFNNSNRNTTDNKTLLKHDQMESD